MNPGWGERLGERLGPRGMVLGRPFSPLVSWGRFELEIGGLFAQTGSYCGKKRGMCIGVGL
jgi:hypothetical protein